jgi:hypothetical protein
VRTYQASHYPRYHLSSGFDADFESLRYIDLPNLPKNKSLTAWHDRKDEAAAAIYGIGTVGFESLFLKGDEITFRTESVEGEYYIFSGTFRWDSKCGTNVSAPSVNGRLIKMRDEKIVAATDASFQLVWGCW